VAAAGAGTAPQGRKAWPTKKEKIMRLITANELATMNETQLRVLFRQVSEYLNRSAAGSAERRNALATLENITRALGRPGFKP
jgi:hypothetical protein